MTLPNYFLADLPPEATLSASMLSQACETLKANRRRYLESRSTASLVQTLSDLAQSWLEPDFPFRLLALSRGPAETGFSRPTLEIGLDRFFNQLTRRNLLALLEQELGHAHRLDEMCASRGEQEANRAAMAGGPELLGHFGAGNIPSPALMSLVLGLVVRSAQFMKCASGASFLPRLFAHSLYEVEPKLGACIEIAEWPGGKLELEQALFAEIDCLTVTGSDETNEALRLRLPAKVRLLAYGHRVSFAFISAAQLGGSQAKRLAARAAKDVAAWNQMGCLSPHVIYVEEGGAHSAEQFAELLAAELERLEQIEPRGELAAAGAAAIASRRSFYEVRSAHSKDTRCWWSANSTAWSVIYEAEPRFQLSCLNRFIYVKSARDLTQVLEAADTVRGKVSTVGLAVPEEKAREFAGQLARWGAARICPLGEMQNPPLVWRHDGRPALGDLVTWSDWESATL